MSSFKNFMGIYVKVLAYTATLEFSKILIVSGEWKCETMK